MKKVSQANILKNTSMESGKIKALIFFNIFDFPLTSLELEKYQLKTKTKFKIEPKFNTGFYYLNDKKLIEKRLLNYKYSLKKLLLVKKYTKIFKIIPFLKNLYIIGKVSFFNANSNSDIDFFVITKPGRIWTTRFFLNLILTILRKRPILNLENFSPIKKQDKFCTSFFSTINNFNFQNILLEKDFLFGFWLISSLSIIEQEEQYLTKTFFKTKFLRDNFLFKKSIYLYKIKNKNLIQTILENIIKFIPEYFFKKLQLIIMPSIIKKSINTKGVTLSDNYLRFYIPDKRQEYNQKFQDKLRLYETFT